MRRYRRFRLRTALAGMLLCSLAFGCVGDSYREWRSEQQALAAIGPVSMIDSQFPVYR